MLLIIHISNSIKMLFQNQSSSLIAPDATPIKLYLLTQEEGLSIDNSRWQILGVAN